MWHRLRRATLAALLPVFSCHCAVAAERVDEHEVKAAVIYNLLLFVQWPQQTPPLRRFHFCVLDDGALTRALRSHENKRVQGLALEIHHIQSAQDDLDACGAVMVEAGNPALLTRLAVSARGRPLLVIADGAGAAERGAMIGLHTDGGRVAFDINHGAMKKSGLVPSSKILRLARTLID